MEMDTEKDTNRVGIYTQESTEATAVGDGLASQGDKSPVAQVEESYNQNEPNKQEKTEMEVVTDARNAKLAVASSTKNYRRHKIQKLGAFPESEERFGKDRWNKILRTLREIGFVDWEMNALLTGLNKFVLMKKRRLERRWHIFIPYRDMETTEILNIIERQNNLPTEKWRVVFQKKWGDKGICLDVELPKNAAIWLSVKHQPLYFLLSRIITKANYGKRTTMHHERENM